MRGATTVCEHLTANSHQEFHIVQESLYRTG